MRRDLLSVRIKISSFLPIRYLRILREEYVRDRSLSSLPSRHR